MLKRLLFLILIGYSPALFAQGNNRIKLTQLEQSKTVESSKAGQIPLTNTTGDLRYAQFVEVDLTPIAFVPTATGNTSNYSEFVTASDGSKWYIDWQGRGYQFPAGGGGSQTISVASNTTTLSGGGGSMTIAGAGINVVTTSGTTITVTGTEVDGLVNNEGSLSVSPGTSTTAIINSNTSGSPAVTLTAGAGLSISEVGNVITLTNTFVETPQTISASGAGPTSYNVDLSAGGGSVTFEEGANVDLTRTGNVITIAATTGGAGQTLSVASNTTTLSGGGGSMTIAGAGINVVTTSGTTITVTGTEVDGQTNNEGILSVSPGGLTTAVLNSNTPGGAPVTFIAGTGLSITETGSSITFNNTDLPQTLSVASNTTTLSGGGGSMTIAGAGINVVTTSGTTITVTGTEVDGLVNNEGSLSVSPGTSTTAIINSNTSGSPAVTLTAGAGLSISEVGNVITLTNTFVETPQTISASGAGPTSYNVDLSAGGGSVTFQEGANVDLTRTGNVITIAATAGGGGYVTVEEEGVPLPNRTTINFVGSTATAQDNISKTDVIFDSDVNALANTGTQGIYVITGVGTSVTRSVVPGSSGISVGNQNGVSNDIIISAANDLAALEALGGTGFPTRTGTETWAQRSIVAGTGNITVTNGDGVAGNPVINNTDPDQNATNEIQAISASGAGPTAYNIDLSLGGGSVTLTEGANIDLTRSGNNITISSTGGGGSGDRDWLVAGTFNGIPDSIGDEIYTYNRAAVGSMAFPSADNDFYIADSSNSNAGAWIYGNRRALLTTKDTFPTINRWTSEGMDNGTYINHVSSAVGNWLIYRAVATSNPSAPTDELLLFNLETATGGDLQLTQYPNTRDDAGVPINIISSAFDGRLESHPLTEILKTQTITDYDTPGTYTYTVPAGAKSLTIKTLGAGGGGGGGRKGAAGAVRGGGGGGGAGAVSESNFSVSALGNPASLTVVVGGGGAGAATTTANSTNGGGGILGGESYCSISTTKFIRSTGGGGGGGGTTAGGLAGPSGNVGDFPGNAGGVGGAATGAPQVTSGLNQCAGPGGGGGGITSANAAVASRTGGNGFYTFVPGGVGGSLGAEAGLNGDSATIDQLSGGGGGGGFPLLTAGVSGKGGNGARGGGGGGGGAGVDSVSDGGGGGNGGGGFVRIIANF